MEHDASHLSCVLTHIFSQDATLAFLWSRTTTPNVTWSHCSHPSQHVDAAELLPSPGKASLFTPVQDATLAFLWSRMMTLDEIKDYAKYTWLAFIGFLGADEEGGLSGGWPK